MKAQFRRELDRSFARVPIDFGTPRYVPMNNLIPDVEIKIVTIDPIIPVETDSPLGWEVQPEEDVVYIPGGTYTLRLRDWGRIDFLSENEKKKSVRGIFSCLSVLSTFAANFDYNYVTYRLQTGLIQSMVIDDFYSLTFEEVEENAFKMPFDNFWGARMNSGFRYSGEQQREYKAMAKTRGKRNTARGKYKRQKYSYHPLIRR